MYRFILAAFAALTLTTLTLGEETDEANGLFEKLYGPRYQQVKHTRDTRDDRQLAAELMQAADGDDLSPAFVNLLMAKTFELASSNDEGFDLAERALERLSQSLPDNAAEWRVKRLDLYEQRYKTARGRDRATTGEKLIDAMADSADALAIEEDVAAATSLYVRAHKIALAIRSARKDALKKRIEYLRRNAGIYEEAAALKKKVAANEDDKASGQRLVELLLIDLDNPAQALKYAHYADETTQTVLKAVNGEFYKLPAGQVLTVARWYDEKSAAVQQEDRHTLQARAHKYYLRFLDLHTVQDVDRCQAGLRETVIARQLSEDPDVVRERVKLDRRISVLEKKLAANQSDHVAADELVGLFLGYLDDPVRAKQCAASADSQTQAVIAAAGSDLQQLKAPQLLATGQWFDDRSNDRKGDERIGFLTHAHLYYLQFLAVHAEQDIDRSRIAIRASKIDNELRQARYDRFTKPAKPNGKAPVADRLIGHWSFDEGKGDMTRDESSFGHHGKLNNMANRWSDDHAPTDGPNKFSLRFEKPTEEVVVAGSAASRLNAPFAVSLWVKIHDIREYGNLVQSGGMSLLLMKEGGRIHYHLTPGVSYYIGCGKELRDKQWHHMAFMYDGHEMTAWIDGHRRGRRLISMNYDTTTSRIKFGDRTVNGWLDEIHIYRRALTADEIQALARRKTN